MIKMIGYPKCSTCKNAELFLKQNNISYEYINIKDSIPSKNDLENYVTLADIDINKFFNTSGVVYKSLDLKTKLKNMTYSEKIELLSGDGMLIKRPILILNNEVVLGFNKEKWKLLLSEKGYM